MSGRWLVLLIALALPTIARAQDTPSDCAPASPRQLRACARARTDEEREACTHYQRARALLLCRRDGHDQTNAALEHEASLELAAAVRVHADWQTVSLLHELLDPTRPVDALALVEEALAQGGGDLPAHHDELEAWRAALDRRLGTLVIHSATPGATLTIDDRAVEIDAPVRVTAERHHVRVAATGFWAEARDVTAVARRTSELTITLVRSGERAWLDLRTDPDGAEVTIDDVPRGVSPLLQLVLSSGGHRVRATLPRYDASEREVVLTSGASEELTLSLSLHREIYEEWWFWTIIVLAVGGGAAALGIDYALRAQAPSGTIGNYP